jgi:hypothetical protein
MSATPPSYPARSVRAAADGFPANGLLVLRPRSPYPLTSDVVVVTAKVTRQFGSSLGTQWAPAVLARFGSGASLVEVRIIAPKGAVAYQVAASADLALRKAAANALLTSEQVAISPMARELLTAGQVDSRLIVVLTAMAAKKHVNIVAFQVVGPGADAGIPRRVVDLAETDPADKLSGQAYLKWMADLLATQPADLRPASVRAVKLADQSVLRIEFAAPSPLGLLGPSAQSLEDAVAAGLGSEVGVVTRRGVVLG